MLGFRSRQLSDAIRNWNAVVRKSTVIQRSSFSSQVGAGKGRQLSGPASYTSGGGNILLLSLLGGGLAGSGYYYYVTQIEPTSRIGGLPPSEPIKPLPSVVPDLVESLPPPPTPSPSLSARDELLFTQQRLEKELGELRTLKRDKLVDMKKGEIKKEIKMIKDGLKKTG